MGAKTWMLVYSEGDAREALIRHPPLDRARSRRFARKLFPGERRTTLDDGDLSDTSPPRDELAIGCFDGVTVVAAFEFCVDCPSQLPNHFVRAAGKGFVTLHATHSCNDWFAYARWVGGTLTRSLSISPDAGIIEDIGGRLPFEEPFWAGQHSPLDENDEEGYDYPIPFNPLDMGEAAALALFGFNFEGLMSNPIDPQTIPLMRFKRIRPWYRFWR